MLTSLTSVTANVLPQVKVADEEMVKLVGKDSMKLHTKNEDLGLMYAPFCPFHAHTFHTEPCARWLAKVEVRRATAARIKVEGEKKATTRAQQHHAASSSSSSAARF